MGRFSTPSSVIDALSGRRANRRGFVRVNCPLCIETSSSRDTTESLAYNTRTNWWKCWRCQNEGVLSDRAREEWDTPDEKKNDTPVKLELPDGFVPLWAGEGVVSELCAEAREYLASRNVSPKIVREARIGVVLKGYAGKKLIRHRVVVPIFDASDKFVGYAARSYRGETPKVLYPFGMVRDHLYNEQALYVHTPKPVYVVEGVFDAFALWPNAVACLGKPTDIHIDKLRRSKRPKLIALDGDAWRQAEALHLKLRILGANVDWFHLPPGYDPAEVRKEWFVNELKERKMGSVKTRSVAFDGDVSLLGKPRPFFWTCKDDEKGIGELWIKGLNHGEAQQILALLDGKTADSSAANGKSKKASRQLELPDPKVAKKGEDEEESEDEEEEESESEDEEEEEEETIPAALKGATKIRDCVQWAVSGGAKNVVQVMKALAPYVGKIDPLKADKEKLKAMVQKRFDALSAESAE